MDQISTNRTQGIELMKAGLHVQTADCYLRQSEYGSELEPTYDTNIIQDFMNRRKLLNSGYQNIASWSLTRLLRLMPKTIDGHQLQLSGTATGWCICYVCDIKTDGNRYLYRFFGGDLFDTTTQMMKRLLADGRVDERHVYVKEADFSADSRPTFGDLMVRNGNVANLNYDK